MTPARMIRLGRLPLAFAVSVAAFAVTIFGAAPARAQSVTQSNLEGRLDKIRQGQRNARIAVEVLMAKHRQNPPPFPNVGNGGRWQNSRGRNFDPPVSGLSGANNLPGGFLPADLGVARTDDFEFPLGYCARGRGGIAADAQILYAVIWPGLDGEFQTNCADVLMPPGHTRPNGLRDSGANGDDYVAFAHANNINAKVVVDDVPNLAALTGMPPAEVEQLVDGELRFVANSNRLYRWNDDLELWEDSSGFFDSNGDGIPDSLTLTRLETDELNITGLNGPLRATNGEVGTFAILPTLATPGDSTSATVDIINGDGAAAGNISIGLRQIPLAPGPSLDGTVIPVPIVDIYGRVTGFNNDINLQNAVGSFSWALGGNLGTVSSGDIGQPVPENTNYLGTNDAKDLRLATNGRVRAILSSEGDLTTGRLNVNGTLNSTGEAIIGNTVVGGGSLQVIGGPSTSSVPLFRIQSFVNEALTEQVTISADGSVVLKSLQGTADDDLSGIDRVVVSAETGLLSQVSTSAFIAANAWTLTGNLGTNPLNNFLGTRDAQSLAFRTNNVERIRVLGGTGATAGFVGIGTNDPQSRLDVAGTFRAGDSTITGTLGVSGLVTASSGVSTPSVSTANTLALAATSGSGTLTFSTAGTERLRVTSTGRVGIGTASPDRTLDVVGTFRASNNAEIGGTLTVTGATTLSSTLAVNNAATFNNAVTIGGLLRANGGTQTTTLNASGNATIGGDLSVIGTSQFTGLVTANGGITTNTLTATTSVTTPLLTNAGALTLSATGASGTIIANTNNIERLRITSTGRVGINTGGTVDAALQVNTGADNTAGLIVRGNSASQSADLFRAVRGTGTNVVSIDQRGNLTLLPYGSAAGNTNELRFAGLSGTSYVGFRAPDTVGANLIWTLPNADGGTGNVLATNGFGVLQWINPLTASSGWTLLGNSATTSGGNLGAAPTADTNFIGTIDNVDLRLVTNNRVRAIITRDGQFQTNNVAIGGGTINGTAIGNTSPSTGVFTTVTANTRVTTPLVTGTSLQLASSAGNLALQATGGIISATTSGVERLRITTGGNVGIATNSPSTTLDVNGTFNATLAATFGNTVTVTGTTSAAKFIPTGGTAAGNGMFLPEANTLAFSTANTERLRIDPNGRVGIGMVPVRTLDITGSFGVTGSADVGGALTVGGATSLGNTLTVAGASTINNTLGVTGLLTASGGLNTTDFVASGTGSVGGTLDVNGATSLADTLTVGGATQINNSLRATGATTLDGTLTVGGASTINNTLTVRDLLTANGGIATTNLTASGNGNFAGTLGVTGATTLSSLGGAARTDLTGLDRVVMSDSTGLLSQVSTATLVGATAWALTGNTGTNPTNNFLGTRDAADLAIRTNNADRIRILGTGANAGFVGINTTAPTATLDVNGGLRIRGDSALSGAVNVGGATILSSTLSVGGITTLTGALNANGGIGTTNLTATGNGIFSGTLNVTGVSTLGTLSAGNTTITGTLGVNGATTLNNGLTVATGATNVGALTASGAVTLTAGTPNGVAFLDGSRVLTTGSALTFAGGNLATTGTATATKFIPTGGTAAGNGMYLPLANEVAFSTNGVERLRLTSGGNVGIGSATPSRTLDVVGTFGATGNTVLGAGLRVTGAAELFSTLTVSGVNTLSNLGGTAATTIPAGLDRIVMANNTGVLSQVSTSALVTANAWTLSGNPIASSGSALGGAPTGSFLGATSNQNLQLVTNNVVQAVITAAGQFRSDNVALGGGTINNTSIGATTANTGRFTTLDATGNATVAGTLGVTGLTTANGGVRTPTVNGSSTLALSADAGTLTLSATGGSGIDFITSSSLRLRVTPTGMVGIGSATPARTLDVSGSFRATGTANFGSWLDVVGATTLGSTLGVNGATTLGSTLLVQNATTLNSTLTVAGASQVNNTLRVTGLLTADTGVRTPSVTSNAALDLAALNADPITFSTGAVERMRVDASGRIGIGTNNPTSAQVMIQNQSPTMPGLMVRGDLLQTGRIIDIQSGSGTTYFSIAPNGETRVARRFITEDETAFQSIAGGSPATLMGDNDRIVVANPQGRVAQVSPGAFVDQYAWGLVGNALQLSGGDLGDFPTGSFLGTTNARDLRLVTNNTVRAILNSADGRFDVASLRAGEVSSAANLILRGGATVEGLRVTTTGRVGVGANVTPDAQLQVNTGLGTTRGLVVNGLSGQTANLFEARVNNAARFSIDAAGLVSAAALQVADVGAGAPNTVTPLGYDRVVVANADGRLSQIAFTQLSNEATWLLGGNTGITSSGGIGSIVGGRFFGMRDAQPIRFVTDDRVRAILTASGQFQTDDVAIGGGTINRTAIGNSNPSTGVFTTLRGTAVTATTSLTTPVVTSTGALALSAADGGLSLAAGGTTNDITFSTAGAQRMLLTSDGRLGLGTTAPGAQLQVNNASAGTKVLVVNGVGGQTANLFEAQVGGSSRFTVTQAGAVTASGGLTAQTLRATALGEGSPNTTTPSGYDRVVIAQSGTGQLSQIAFSQLTNENTWLLAGNLGATSGGDLGSAPTPGSRFLGTRDDVDLRFVTNNVVRAMIDFNGVFRANQVALTGGTIDGVTIGGTTRAPGSFTTVVAGSTVAAGTNVTAGSNVTAGVSVITPLVTNTGNLGLTAVNGALSLATTGAVSPGGVSVSAAGNNAITFSTNNNERLRIEGAQGFVGINTASPGAQLQVNAPIDSSIGMIVRSQPTAVADVFAARVGAADVFRVRPTEAIFAIPLTVNGSTTVSSLNVSGAATVAGATRLSALGGTAGALSGDRVVVANSAGDLSQVARATLVTSEAWGLSGNANIGAGNFIGTTDANDLRFRTNNITRVTITAGGQLQSANVALTGGSINGVTIGNTTPANGNFVTLGATTVNAGSVNTPLVNRTNGALTLSTTSASGGSAGALILAAGSESSILFRTTDAETERMRLTTDGRLAIGLTSPSRTLDVAGTFGATGDADIGGTLGIGSRLTVAGSNGAASNSLTVNGTSLTKISSLGGDRNEVVLAGFDRVVLANAVGELQQFDLSQFKRVTDPDDPAGGGGSSSIAVDDEGIQLTLALARLNFTGQGVTATASGNNITVDIPGVNGTLTRDPEFDTVRVTDWVRTPRIDSLGAFAVRTGGTADDRLTITSGGDVGIGTTTPGARLQVATTDDSTVGLRITGISTSPAANLLEVGTTGSPSNFRVERSGTVVTAGNLSVTSGAVTFGGLGGGAGSSMGGNDRVIVANGSGRLSQVSPATFVASTGWSLAGNSLTATDPLNPPALGGAPVDRFLGTTSATDLQLVTNNVVRALITADGVFQSDNAVLTGGRIDGMPIGGTTRASGAFTTLAANTTITAGTSVTTPRLLNPGDITITAGVANPPPGEIAGNIALTAVSGSLAFSTVGTDPRGISFSAAGNNPIVFSTDGRERMRLTGGLFGPIGIGTATPDELAMLQISASGDAAKGLVIAGTPGATDDLLSVGITGGPSLNTVLTARRTGVSVTSLVPGTTALNVNGRTQITGSLQATESVTFNTLAGDPLATLGSNNRVVVANGSGVLSQVSPEGLVADYAWALTGNAIDSSGGALGAGATGRFIGTTSNVDLRFVTNGLVRAIVTRGGQFQTDNALITGGAISNTPIGSGGRASGAFSALSATEVIGAPGVSGGNLALTASTGNLGITANSGRVTLTARGAANPIVFATRPIDDDVPRLTITPDGQIGIGTGVPTAQLQVESADDGVVGLAVNGTASATGAALLTVNRGSTSVLSVGRTASTLGTTLTVTGTTSVPALNASGAVTFASLAGGAGAEDADYDRVVVANSSGRLRQIARNTLVTNSAWGLSGNANTGPSNFLGTTDDADLRFGTNGAIRATLTSGGVFQISNVAIAGGAINGTTIGLTAPASARFTTVEADTSVTTPTLRNAGALAVTTTAGNLSLNAGGLSRITAATNGTERLRIDEDGRVFIGDRDLNGPALIDPANDSLPQLQVNSAAAVSPALVARGYPGQVANLLEVQGYDLATTSFQRELTVNAAGVVNLRSLGGATNPVVTVGDRLVVSNAQGRLMQVDTVKLITSTTWGLTGNAVITQPGNLGEAPTGNFLGTTDARDVGFVTNNRIRAMIDSGGTFRTAGNLVANGVTVGRGLDAMPGNTAVGTGALADNNGGDENSAFGTDALRLNTLGNRNTALGVRAMQGNFVGLNNTAVGVDALRTNFAGNGNVALGFEAGFNETGSNRLYIANSRTANLIVGDFANGRLLVNAGATPPATLGAALQVDTVNAGDVGFIVRGASGQTANLFEARNNGGTAVARISNAGNANFNGTLGVLGATTLSSTLNVGGATALGNALTVANTTTLNGATQVNSTLTVTGVTALGTDLSVGGNGTVAGTLDVTGATRLRNTVQVDGATTINNTLNVTGNTTVGGTLGVTSTATATKFIPTGNVVAGNGMFLPATNEVAFSTNGAERLRLDNNGNVGVGTDDPQVRLDVNGSFRATTNAIVGGTLGVTGATTLGDTLAVTGTTTSSKFIPTGGTAAGNGMYLPAANNLAFSTAGTERLRIDANGLVGIGAGTAARTLDVFGTFGATGAATLNSTLAVSGNTTVGGTLGVSGVTTLTNLGGAANGTIGGNDRIVVANNTGVLSNVSVSALFATNAWGLSGNPIASSGSALGGAPTGSFLGATSNQNLQLVTNNVVQAVITAAGQFRTDNVALGGGTINNTSIGATTANTGRFTSLAATGNATVDGTTTLTGLLTANGGVRTPTVNGSSTLALSADAGTLTLSATGGSGIDFITSSSLRLRVTPTGMVGIGSATPARTLDVSGSFRATGTANFGSWLDVVGATTLGSTLQVTGLTSVTSLTASGAVTLAGGTINGIPYLNSDRVLTTGSGLTFDGTNLATTGIATARKFALITGGNNTGNGMYMPTASVLAFSTNGGERLRIDTSGDVGIGTNSPQRRLDVAGTFRASGAAEIGGTLTATGGLENTAIGATTANTGRFTTLAATSDASVAGTLEVNGAASLSGALTVVGVSTFTGALTANGSISTTTLNTFGAGTIGGLLTANNGISTTAITASSDGTFAGVLRAAGGIENTAIGTITANTGRFTDLTATGATTLTGLLTANGGVGTTSLTTSGAAVVGTTLRVDGATNLVGNLAVNGVTTLVNSLSADGGIETPTLEVTGSANVGGLLAANGGVTTTTLGASGDLTLQPATGASVTNALRFTDLSGGNAVGFRAPTVLTGSRIWTLPGADGDSGNVLATDGAGSLQWVSPLTASTGWALNGNTGGASGGALGAAPTGRFLGTRDNIDLRLATNNVVRAIITADGQFRTDNVAVGGGTIANATINNSAIGAGGANTGAFTTLAAASFATTGDATVGGRLAVAGAAAVDSVLEAKGGIQTNALTASTTLTVTGVTLLNSAVTANDGLTVNDGIVTESLTSADALQLAALASSVTISTASAERLRVDGLGNVGVGTDAPTAKLDVNGKVRARSDLAVDGRFDVTGATTMTGALNAIGGISATAVSTGTLSASGASTLDGTVTLADLGGVAATGTDLATFDRVVLADSTGRLRQLALSSMTGNGWLLAGNAGTTSGGALGAAPTTGTRFLGTTDGVDLRLVTANVVRAIITADGALSTQQDITVNSVLVGRGAGGQFSNTVVGNQALSSPVTGLSAANTALGYRALRSLGDGMQNTALGANALSTLTEGYYNTAIGATAGNTVGLAGGASLTLAWESLFIGNNTRAAGDGQTNQIVIGNNAVGLGSNSVVLGDSAIATTLLRGTVIARGANGQTGDLFEAQVWDGTTATTVARIGASGAATLAGLTVNGTAGTPNVTFASLGGAANAAVPDVAFDRVVVADSAGRLQQLALTSLSGSGWSLNGSAGTTSGGALGGAPTGSVFGTLDNVDLRLVTNNLVRAILSADGTLSTQRDMIVNGVRIGRGGGGVDGNTAVGFNALGSNGTGSQNTAVGHSAMQSHTTGQFNTAIGLGALSSLTTGTGNTALGHWALLENQTGARNVAIGFQAGFNETRSNRLYISSGSRDLIFGNFDTRRMVINATQAEIDNDPVAALQVNVAGSTPANAQATIGLMVRGVSGQTADLLQLRDNSDAVLMRVTADGSMGLGKAPGTGFKLDVEGDIRGTNVYAGGVLLTSDARFKTNIQAITDALSIVRKLQGVSYDWNRAAFPDRGFSDRPQIGVLAQEVEKVLPELVSTDAQGFKSVNYTGFVPVLIEGMKQQADRLDAQDARLVTAEQTLAMVEERLFKAEEQVVRIDERLGQAEAFVARFELTREPDTMVVLTPTFKVQNLTAERAYIEELRAQRIEAEKARFKELDADGAVIDNVEAARLRGRVVNTGGKELFVSYGTVAPLFEAAADGHYIVSVTADDGSFATAQVVNAGGVVRVVPTASQGIDVVAKGNSVGLVAPSKKVKASWTRTG